MDVTMKFLHDADVSCLVFRRKDGHELSLSSYDKSLVHFDGGKTVKDYGSHASEELLQRALAEFKAA